MVVCDGPFVHLFHLFSAHFPDEEVTRPVSNSYVMVALSSTIALGAARIEVFSCFEMQILPPSMVRKTSTPAKTRSEGAQRAKRYRGACANSSGSPADAPHASRERQRQQS